ncbi:hypothetical protein, partial [Mesorhizobium sp.]|uniref:hypothetical protein n=1 Tax=Mesorhizobium sp. TaxID=1871066 RepID=UPI0025C30F98
QPFEVSDTCHHADHLELGTGSAEHLDLALRELIAEDSAGGPEHSAGDGLDATYWRQACPQQRWRFSEATLNGSEGKRL